MVAKRYSSWMLERIAIGESVRLRLGSNTIGRHFSSNIRVLEAVFVSRNHAVLNVAENDEDVSIEDLSSNGIFINDERYDRQTVPLKNTDVIGLGISPTNLEDGVDVTSLPIYQLKYAPIRTFQAPNVARLPAKPASSINDDKSADSGKNKIESNYVDRDVQNPSCSKVVRAEEPTKVIEIFEISDDEDNDVVQKPQKESKENQKDLLSDLKKQIDIAIENESSEENFYINPSQKSQDNKSGAILTKSSTNPIITTDMVVSEKKDGGNEEEQNQVRQVTPSNSADIREIKETNDPIMHVPIISNIKREQLRSVSNDIKNIFGDIGDDIEMHKAIRDINPLVYNEINETKNLKLLEGQVKILSSGDCISLTDDENLDGIEEVELGTIIPNTNESKEEMEPVIDKLKKEVELDSGTLDTANTKLQDCIASGEPKSPNVFDSSLDNSKEELTIVQGNDKNHAQKPDVDNIDLEEYTKYEPNSDDEDIEDLMFSQVIIDDMKAEFQNTINTEENLEPLNSNNVNQEPLIRDHAGITTMIKQEPGLELSFQIPKELEDSCWIISDDEDYDKELESKVNDWSNKIFSQSYNLMSQNMSQVYEMEEFDKNGRHVEDEGSDDDNISLLEDDLDGIADIYTSIERSFVDKSIKPRHDEDPLPSNELNKKNSKENMPKTCQTDDQKKKEEKLTSMEDKHVKAKEIDQENLIESEEDCPADLIIDSGENFESPIARVRRTSKTNPITDSSSSENELDTKNNEVNTKSIVSQLDKPKTKLPPPVIEAPALPKHKGKLRGVSAHSSNISKTLHAVKEKVLHERISKDLKRKWLEKPSISKKRDKERKKCIKECRKDRLKELAERNKGPPKENFKRKHSTDDIEQKAKVAKVKVTTHNRGAFLVNNDPLPPPPPPAPATHNNKVEPTKSNFKIPKLVKKPDESIKSSSVESNNKVPPTRSLSVDGVETFSQQISKPDILLHKQQSNETKKCNKSSLINKPNSAGPLRRHSVTDTMGGSTLTNLERKKTPPPSSNTISKDAIAKRAIRTTNKITFASMEKNIIENEENKRKLNELSTVTLKPSNKPVKKSSKKTVRFNDTPIIHYIERITGACKKIINKDIMPMTSYKERRHRTRNTYPIVDKTDQIISNILCWSNEWLIKRNAAADAAGEVIFPMPTQFSSLDHYHRIIFPLLKLEFISTLEREYNANKSTKTFKVSLDLATLKNDRIMLVTKLLTNQTKEILHSCSYDLVVLEPDKRGPQIFAFIMGSRKGAGAFFTIVYEIIAKNFTLEYIKMIKEFTVRPVMDNARVHFGAFNSVYQLESTPLFQKIIDPMELIKCRPPPKKKVIYRGFDQLNEKQRQVLLQTYTKIIDEHTPNITLIQGPPGTGKSLVITNLVLQTLYGEEVRYLDKKILICAQSNAAVDVIAGKLYDVSMRMRPEKRFRLIRYGMLQKIHPSVLPVALQKVVERDQLNKLQAKNENMHLENKENLKNQILQFEAHVAEMSSRNIKGTVEEDVLIEKKRQLQLMRNILNQTMRPEDERSLYSWYLCNANIICATLSSCVNLSQYIDFFDICIIDESTQCSEPWTLLPLKFAINSLVLVGDTQQLPATVISKKANELGLGTSMFTRIQQCLDSIRCTNLEGSKINATTPHNIIFSLQTQYRMHPEICLWPNQYFYRNELINAKSTIDFNKTPLLPFCILNLTYTQNTTGVNGKITNNLEAEFVAKLLKALDGFIPNRYNSYGVITPYAHHRATLESSLRGLGLTNIMVNTIDSYQGTEKDVIVVSNARTNGVGFLCNPQRLNVALTRAKKCLILCGNFRNLESVPAWRCLLESARKRKMYHDISANCVEDIQTNVIDKIKLKNQNQLC